MNRQLLDRLENGDEFPDHLVGRRSCRLFGIARFRSRETLPKDLDSLLLKFDQFSSQLRVLAHVRRRGRGEEVEESLDEAAAVKLVGRDRGLVLQDGRQVVQCTKNQG